MTTTVHYDALDDFAGPGGWDEGARMLGLRLLGVEHDRAACATAEAAGHARICADVTTHSHTGLPACSGYVGSPPCTLFSVAGPGVGRRVLGVLAAGIGRIFAGDDATAVRRQTRDVIYPVTLVQARVANARRRPERRWDEARVEAQALADAVVAVLVLEPARRIVEMDPEWVALEQVPEVLPLWKVYAHELRKRGYSAWAVVLNAADYGVPQTRRRAFMGASRVRAVLPPAPTHAESPQGGDLFGGMLSGWVSMAEALGWGWEDEPSCTVSSGGAATGGAEPFANADYRKRLADHVIAQRRDSGPGAEREPRPVDQPSHTIRAQGSGKAPAGVEWVLHTNRDQRPDGSRQTRPVSEPAPTVTAKSGEEWKRRPSPMGDVRQANGSVRDIAEPSPTITSSMDNGNFQWVFDRPATTVVGSFKPEVIAAPGYRTKESRQNAPGSVSVSVSEAGVLQSFPAGYPWQGSRSKQYEQVGNAVPPLLAAHVLSAVTGVPLPLTATEAADMTPYYRDELVTLYGGDCLDVLRSLPDASVDAVVTDPPYGLSNTDPAHVVETITRWTNGERDYLPGGSGFMGKTWDAFVPPVAVWDDCLRVLKPGGHVLAFAGSRTFDLMTLSLRLAGFDIRDSIAWLYGSGFPKSLDVSKAIDKAAGVEREVVGIDSRYVGMTDRAKRALGALGHEASPTGFSGDPSLMTAPATPDAERWQGWGTALKPAFEPIVVARKPLTGTVAANVLAHGTGALNIDGCRTPAQGRPLIESKSEEGVSTFGDGLNGSRSAGTTSLGRWPANVILDESQAVELDAQNGETDSRRFFYVVKADTAERVRINDVAHPTVKPLALCRWLVRLVTPPGGLVLDPFAGSGTTVEACLREGLRCLAIEREADYLPLIRQRLARRLDPVEAVRAAGEDGGLFDLLGEATT